MYILGNEMVKKNSKRSLKSTSRGYYCLGPRETGRAAEIRLRGAFCCLAELCFRIIGLIPCRREPTQKRERRPRTVTHSSGTSGSSDIHFLTGHKLGIVIHPLTCPRRVDASARNAGLPVIFPS